MKWEGRRGSDNIEDRRGGGARMAGGGLGLGAVALFLASVFFPDAVPLLQMLGFGAQTEQTASAPVDPNDPQAKFVSVVLADTESIWQDIFREQIGANYPQPKLVLFNGATSSACGTADTAAGPFYCPGDRKVYIDLAFYRTLETRLKAKGDFAKAYVVAHEVAHHVQNVTGIIPKVDAYRRGADKVESNRATVRLELQADCYSGVWANKAHQKYGILEEGDIQEALNAASQIGDDTLQRAAKGYVVPDSFTHGTSEQRMKWFFTGLKTGNIKACDTFSQEYEAL